MAEGTSSKGAPAAAAAPALRTLSIWNADNKKFCSNEIITSHYTVLNFLPKNLFEQFHKVANVYFLILTCLQCVPAVSITGGVPTILLPLMTVLAATALKDGIEDSRRHKSDAMENNRITDYVAKDGTVKQKSWTQVAVGDILVVKNQEFFPADLLLLCSTDPHGIVFIETANLDGETNLKLKQAPEATTKLVKETESLEVAAKEATKLSGVVECQPPNKLLYQFEGTLDIKHESLGGEKVALDPKPILLRACKLRNTTWALGLVIYTGPDTKIQMNSAGKTKRKTSKVEGVMFWLTGYIFLLQCTLALVCAIGGSVFATSDEAMQRTYLNLLDDEGNTKNAGLIIFIGFFTFILLFANFIPISLLVTMGIAKLCQVFFIFRDEDMRYKGQLAAPRNSDLNEELGQIDYCFTDKTGTLTCNIMEFRTFSANGKPYGDGLTEIRRNVMKREGKEVPPEPRPKPGAKITPNVNFISDALEEILKKRSGEDYMRIRNLLLHLAINHEVMPEFKEKDGKKELAYSASSPDEGALVYGARHFGFEFKERDPSGILIALDDGTLVKVRILAILEFNSRRKRSSVICQFQDKLPDGNTKERFMIFCKGADSVIKELLHPREKENPKTFESFQNMEQFARDGLRTLVLAGRDIERSEFEKWFKTYEAATLSMTGRQAMMDAAAAEIEFDFEFHGITGIEDRLQDGVADTIVKMQEAGIKVWMLTGDKVETAINIGVATGLLEPQQDNKKIERPVLDWEKLEINEKLEDKLSPQEIIAEAKTLLGSMGDGSGASTKRASTGRLSLTGAKPVIDPDTAAKQNLEDRLKAFEDAVASNDAQAIEVVGAKLQTDVIAGAKRKACLEVLLKYNQQAEEHAKAKNDGTGPFEAVVVDGSCLAVALEPRYSNAFIDMCKPCKTVICCRVSPEQKGLVVRTMRDKEKVITLAIGDGANDCNMIKSADVGVGLRGEEGLQAFNVCDYGISQFRFLQYLLLVHGRWAYRRITKLVLYMFYKNIVVVGPQFFYALTNGFSGQKLYHDVMYQSYNVFFTALPILIFGVLDQDVSKEMSLRYPVLYEIGRYGVYFNNKVFIQWMLCGLWHSAVIFVIPYFALSNGAITFSDGRANDIWLVGTIVFLLVIIVTNIKVVVETVHMSSLVYLGLFLSFFAWLGMQAFLSGAHGKISASTATELFGSTSRILGSPVCWLVIIATTVIAVIRDWQWKAVDIIRGEELAMLHEVQAEMLQERRKGKSP